MGVYSRWALIRGWALIKFSTFSASVVCVFSNKTINGNNRTRTFNKARFLKNTLKKTPFSGKSLISTYSILGVVANLSLSGSERKVWWGGRLFEFDWEEEGVGAYSRLGAY